MIRQVHTTGTTGSMIMNHLELHVQQQNQQGGSVSDNESHHTSSSRRSNQGYVSNDEAGAVVAPVVVDFTLNDTTRTGASTMITPGPKAKMDWISRLTWFLALVMMAGIIAIGVLVWNLNQQSKDSNNNSDSQHNLLPLPQYYDLLSQHLSQVRLVTGLTDPQTDAYKTLEWMAFEDGAVLQLLSTSTPPHGGTAATATATLDIEAVEQRVAIAMFFFATAGAEFWNTDWLLPGKDECTLDGIVCNDQHQIVQLELVQRSLLGTLPPELAFLTQLQRLDVHQNRLYGTLPPEFLQSFTQLSYLDISFNSMTGSLPSNWSAMSKLTDFAAQLNSFQGPLPRQLPQSLKYFSIDGNRLQGTIPWDHWMDYMMTTTLSKSQGNSSNSNYYYYDNTTHIEDEFGGGNDQPGRVFLDLRVLDVGANTMIEGVISPLIATIFPRLVSLGLYRTHVQGTIPSELGNCRRLEELSLASSKLTGTIPATLYQLSNLQWLVAGSTKLQGTLSTLVSQLQSLQVFNLVNTLISGTLPTELGAMSQLEWLQLSDSQVEGTIPTELGQLSNLSRLWLHHTRLQGDFPNEACPLPAVQNDMRLDCEGGFPVYCTCCHYCF